MARLPQILPVGAAPTRVGAAPTRVRTSTTRVGAASSRDRTTRPARAALDCLAGTACAILPLRPEPGRRTPTPVAWNCHTKGIDHQSRPAYQPDDPDPTG